MKYKVIENFTDLQDKNFKYQAGDSFPRNGYEPSKARIQELLTDKNRRHRPMIIATGEPEIFEEVKAEPVEEVKVSKRGKKKKNAE